MASQLTLALQAGAERGDPAATAWLKEQETTNFAGFMQQLCVELGSADRAKPVRQLAGLTIKNALDARSEAAAMQLHNRWKVLPQENKSSIKNMLLQILRDPEADIRRTAALVVGKIAGIEINATVNEWPELIPALDANITKQPAGAVNAGLRQASLEALGYVCEEVPNGLNAFSNQILTAIASGMDERETNAEIKLAATVCLVNSVEFIKHNMENETERGVIYNMVFSVTKSTDLKVRVAAFQCLVQIASSYYATLPPFMGAIFAATTAAIKSQPEEVGLQAIEFWSTVADVELECLEEDEDAPADHKSRSFHFIKSAVPQLMPVLLECLTKQNEDPEEEEWGIALAAGTCLGLCAQVAGNEIVPHVLPFVQGHVQHENWRLREAAILAFGCILDGPRKEDLTQLVQQAFQLILAHMADKHPLVKDTTAWTLGRICMLLPEVIDAATLPTLMNTLIAGLSETPKVASNVAWAIHNLASSVDVDPANPNTSVLSPFFQPVVQALLQASVRPDVKEANLQVSVYEALNIMVHEAAPDVHPLIVAVLPMIGGRLEQTLNERPSSSEEREALNESQALLCGTLQSIITTLDVSAIQPHADMLMTLFLRVLQSKNATVHEEALMAIGAVADKVEGQFVKYMDHVKAPLLQGLDHAEEYHVCSVAVHVTCDVARAVGVAFQPWGDDVMKTLLKHLHDASVVRTVKNHIIACIGDIALALGGHFERYLSYVIPVLTQAAQVNYKHDDWDNVDYLQGLRESIIEAFSGILLGLSGDNKVALFVQQQGLLGSIVNLINLIADDPNVTERVLRGTCGLIFDLVKLVGPAIAQQLKTPQVEKIIQAAADKECEEETIQAAQAARQALMS